MKIWAGLFCFFFFSFASQGFAQQKISLNIPSSWGSLASPEGAYSVYSNPSALGFEKGSQFFLLFSDLSTPLSFERSDGVSAAFSHHIPFLRWSTGLGLQMFPNQPTQKNTELQSTLHWSNSFLLSSWFSLGFGLQVHLSSNPDIHGLVNSDFSATIRPTNWLSWALVLRNAFSPSFGSETVPRSWETGFTLRPLQDNRLSLSVDFALNESSLQTQLRYQVLSEPIPGFFFGLQASHNIPLIGETIQWSAGLTLGFRFGAFGLGTSNWLQGGNSSKSPSYGGFSVAMWVKSIPDVPLVKPSLQIAMLDIHGSLPERNRSFSLSSGNAVFLRYIRALERFRDDSSIHHLLLRIGNLNASFAKIQELRHLLLQIKKKKKKILVYLNSSNMKDYYLASVADKIFLHPMGNLWMKGLLSQRLFMADFLKKIGIKPEFIKAGKYKSAPSRYTQNDYSKEEKKASLSLLNNLFNQMVQALQSSRKRPKKEVKAWFAKGLFNAKECLQEKMVEDLFYWDQIDQKLKEHLSEPVEISSSYFSKTYQRKRWKNYPQIAVLHVDGVITGGSNQDDVLFGNHTAGSSTITSYLRQLMYNPEVKAVVLRVNSPGGGVFASDLIWRYVSLLKKRKPVIVSMGSVAASGGYYISAPATEIFASKATITGSIGVFAGKVDFSGLLKKIGIHPRKVQIGAMADLYDLYNPLTSSQRKEVQKQIDHTYSQFLEKVAEGRKLKKEAVHQLAQGRVWTGEQALQSGLIDKIGGLSDAIQRAKELSGLKKKEPIDIVSFPNRPHWHFSLAGITSFIQSSQKSSTLTLLHEFKKTLQIIQRTNLWMIYDSPIPR